jgi:hypothetical protein
MILRQDEPSLLIPTSNPPRARSRWGAYRESGLVHGGTADIRLSSIVPEARDRRTDGEIDKGGIEQRKRHIVSAWL